VSSDWLQTYLAGFAVEASGAIRVRVIMGEVELATGIPFQIASPFKAALKGGVLVA
jgi:exosome complex RNA-binding protein Rrp42 (RNase PH superfamily)